MNLDLSCRWFRLNLTSRRDWDAEDEQPTLTANGAGNFERAEPTHIGFAAPEWPEDKK